MSDPVSFSGVTQAIRTILDGGWRIGLLAFLMGGSIWIADFWGLPRPGAFADWVPLAAAATILGFAAMLTSAVVRLAERVHARIQARIAANLTAKDVLANLETLTTDEQHTLARALKALPARFQAPDTGECYALFAKGILRKAAIPYVGHTLWEVHPSVAAIKDRLLMTLNTKSDRG
jgi:hypothetical protein